MSEEPKSFTQRLGTECKKVVLPIRFWKMWSLVGFPIVGELIAAAHNGHAWPVSWVSGNEAVGGAIGLAAGGLYSWWLEVDHARGVRRTQEEATKALKEKEDLLTGYVTYAREKEAKGEMPSIKDYLGT